MVRFLKSKGCTLDDILLIMNWLYIGGGLLATDNYLKIIYIFEIWRVSVYIILHELWWKCMQML